MRMNGASALIRLLIFDSGMKRSSTINGTYISFADIASTYAIELPIKNHIFVNLRYFTNRKTESRKKTAPSI